MDSVLALNLKARFEPWPRPGGIVWPRVLERSTHWPPSDAAPPPSEVADAGGGGCGFVFFCSSSPL